MDITALIVVRIIAIWLAFNGLITLGILADWRRINRGR